MTVNTNSSLSSDERPENMDTVNRHCTLLVLELTSTELGRELERESLRARGTLYTTLSPPFDYNENQITFEWVKIALNL